MASRCRRRNDWTVKASGNLEAAHRASSDRSLCGWIMRPAAWKCNGNMFTSGWIVMVGWIFCTGAAVSSLQHMAGDWCLTKPGGGRSLWLIRCNVHGGRGRSLMWGGCSSVVTALYVAWEVSKQSLLDAAILMMSHLFLIILHPPFPDSCSVTPTLCVPSIFSVVFFVPPPSQPSPFSSHCSSFQSSFSLHSCPSFLSRCLLRCLPPLLFLCGPAVAPPPPCWPTAPDKVSLTLSTFPKYTRSKSRYLTLKHKPSCEHDDVTWQHFHFQHFCEMISVMCRSADAAESRAASLLVSHYQGTNKASKFPKCYSSPLAWVKNWPYCVIYKCTCNYFYRLVELLGFYSVSAVSICLHGCRQISLREKSSMTTKHDSVTPKKL